MDNYYEILGVSSDTDDDGIRKAYSTMLKKYQPEKYPEEFKKIVEAYKTLRDPKARAAYNALSKYKDEIDSSNEKGLKAMQEENYALAITEFKKVLLIEPSLSYVRNNLALAMMGDNQYDNAIKQYEILTSENDTSATYFYNLAMAFNGKKEYEKALRALTSAIKLDRFDPDIPVAISKIYVKQEKYDYAIDVLRKAIDSDGILDIKDFIYLYELLHVYVYSDRIPEFDKTIQEIMDAVQSTNDSDYVATHFAKLGIELYEAERYNLAVKLLKRAMDLDPSEDVYKEIYDEAIKLDEIYKQWELLRVDDSIPGPIKGPIVYFVYSDEQDEKKREKDIDENLEAIQSYIDNATQETIRSINTMKTKYRVLYELKKEIYDEILRLATAKSNTSTSSSSSGSSDCFVATAAFGTPWANEINVLRAWRDNKLAYNAFGRAFIKFYYAVGPYLAKLVKKSYKLKSVARRIIYLIIKKIDSNQ